METTLLSTATLQTSKAHTHIELQQLAKLQRARLFLWTSGSKICFVIHIAGEKQLLFYIYAVIVKQFFYKRSTNHYFQLHATKIWKVSIMLYLLCIVAIILTFEILFSRDLPDILKSQRPSISPLYKVTTSWLLRIYFLEPFHVLLFVPNQVTIYWLLRIVWNYMSSINSSPVVSPP